MPLSRRAKAQKTSVYRDGGIGEVEVESNVCARHTCKKSKSFGKCVSGVSMYLWRTQPERT